MTSEFLNYSVARSTDPHSENRYVVTAEYTDGYSLLSFHKTKAEAFAMLKHFEAHGDRKASS
jgi:hypothetical protein